MRRDPVPSSRSRTSNSSARSPVIRTLVTVVPLAVTSTSPRPFSTYSSIGSGVSKVWSWWLLMGCLQPA